MNSHISSAVMVLKQWISEFHFLSLCTDLIPILEEFIISRIPENISKDLMAEIEKYRSTSIPILEPPEIKSIPSNFSQIGLEMPFHHIYISFRAL